MLSTIYNGYGGWTGNATTLNYSSFLPWASDPAKLADQLQLILMGGAMSDAMKSSLIAAISQIPATLPGERMRTAIYLVTTSSEFAIQK